MSKVITAFAFGVLLNNSMVWAHMGEHNSQEGTEPEAVHGSMMLGNLKSDGPVIELYKSPNCGCCEGWAKIMLKKGYRINVHNQQQWNEIKSTYSLPPKLQSCHSAVIDGYLIEGHVPAEDIARLLKQKPDNIKGIAVPGMPQYAPGMAVSGNADEYKGFAVIAYPADDASVYHQY